MYSEDGVEMSLCSPAPLCLKPYEAGRSVEEVRRTFGLSRVIKLASNENPLGASPLALNAIAGSLRHLNFYPNGGLDLREVLAREFDVKVENVIAGSGSEGIMSNIIRAFLAMRTRCSPPRRHSSDSRCWPDPAA